MLRRNKEKKPVHRKPLRIKTGDMVLVIAGEGRSKTPRQVLGVLPRENKVLVEGVNVMKDHPRQSRGGRQSGINQQGIVEKPCPIARANVALIDPQSKKPTRIRMKEQGEGRRARVAVRSGETL